jgi:hypothetical protein
MNIRLALVEAINGTSNVRITTDLDRDICQDDEPLNRE